MSPDIAKCPWWGVGSGVAKSPWLRTTALVIPAQGSQHRSLHLYLGLCSCSYHQGWFSPPQRRSHLILFPLKLSLPGILPLPPTPASVHPGPLHVSMVALTVLEWWLLTHLSELLAIQDRVPSLVCSPRGQRSPWHIAGAQLSRSHVADRRLWGVTWGLAHPGHLRRSQMNWPHAFEVA